MLDGFSLRLEPGGRIALLGASGAGKTTVVNLLLRFLDPERGRVTLGGRDLRDYRQDDVRRAIAVAGQDAHLFSASIRENVRLRGPRRATPRSSTRSIAPGSGTGSATSRTAWTRTWASRAVSSRRAAAAARPRPGAAHRRSRAGARRAHRAPRPANRGAADGGPRSPPPASGRCCSSPTGPRASALVDDVVVLP